MYNSMFLAEQEPKPALFILSGTVVASLMYFTILKLWSKASHRWLKSYRTLNDLDKLDWEGRGPSTVHAVGITAVIVYLFATDVFDEGKVSHTPYVHQRSLLSTTALVTSSGYFASDLVMLIIHYPTFGDAVMGIHHLAALASVLSSALTGHAHAYTLLLLATEATTPFVNFRWLMDKANMREHPIYVANGMAMALSWAIVRMWFMMFYIFPLMYRNAAETKLMNVFCRFEYYTIPPLLFIMNVFWFWKILKGALSLLSKTKKKS